MYKCLVFCLLVVGSTVAVPASTVACPEGVEGIACLGSNIAKNVVSQVLGGIASDNSEAASARQLWNGIELLHVADNNSSADSDAEEGKGRDLSASFLQNLRKLVSSYEIRVRLSEVLNGAIDELSEEAQGRKGGGGGLGGLGGGKKGGGMMMMMMMMGGMMKAMALGALGLLAMKALAVSSMAFLLSAVVGLKKLVSKKDDDDGGHYVQVVGGGGHGGGGGDYHHRRSFVVAPAATAATAAHSLAFRGQRK